MRKRPAYLFAAAAALFSLAGQAEAQTQPCWDVPTVSAARISEFETLMMVSVLRCRSVGMDMRADLDRFQTVQRAILEKAHEALRARFGVARTKQGNNGYDRFVTGVANVYGMGRTEAGLCQQVGTLLADLAKAETGAEVLADAVIQMVRDPHLVGERCMAGTLAQK